MALSDVNVEVYFELEVYSDLCLEGNALRATM